MTLFFKVIVSHVCLLNKDMLFVNKSASKGRFKMVLNVLECLSPGGKVQFASLYRSSVCKRLMNGLSDLEAEKMFLDGWNGVMIDEACRRSLKMIQEVSVKSPVLSGSIWPTPYRQNTQVVTEITDAKIKQKIQEEQSKIEKSLKTDQVVYCWQEASQVVLKKPNVVVSIPQFKVLKKVLKNDKLSERELVISAQLQKPGYPKSGGVLLDGTLKINPDVGKGANFCVNADFMVVQQ